MTDKTIPVLQILTNIVFRSTKFAFK